MVIALMKILPIIVLASCLSCNGEQEAQFRPTASYHRAKRDTQTGNYWFPEFASTSRPGQLDSLNTNPSYCQEYFQLFEKLRQGYLPRLTAFGFYRKIMRASEMPSATLSFAQWVNSISEKLVEFCEKNLQGRSDAAQTPTSEEIAQFKNTYGHEPTLPPTVPSVQADPLCKDLFELFDNLFHDDLVESDVDAFYAKIIEGMRGEENTPSLQVWITHNMDAMISKCQAEFDRASNRRRKPTVEDISRFKVKYGGANKLTVERKIEWHDGAEQKFDVVRLNLTLEPDCDLELDLQINDQKVNSRYDLCPKYRPGRNRQQIFGTCFEKNQPRKSVESGSNSDEPVLIQFCQCFKENTRDIQSGCTKGKVVVAKNLMGSQFRPLDDEIIPFEICSQCGSAPHQRRKRPKWGCNVIAPGTESKETNLQGGHLALTFGIDTDCKFSLDINRDGAPLTFTYNKWPAPGDRVPIKFDSDSCSNSSSGVVDGNAVVAMTCYHFFTNDFINHSCYRGTIIIRITLIKLGNPVETSDAGSVQFNVCGHVPTTTTTTTTTEAPYVQNYYYHPPPTQYSQPKTFEEAMRDLQKGRYPG